MLVYVLNENEVTIKKNTDRQMNMLTDEKTDG